MSDLKILALLPVRNGAEDLPAFLESVRSVADGVLALDDGSTDETPTLLRSDPFVRLVLENPTRPTYAGWDDSANRTRLLQASESFSPEWIVWFDADELVDPLDGAALRAFLGSGAKRDCAYGVRVFRMIDGLDQHDKAGLWVYRIFAYRPGQTLSSDTLHFEPIPVDIPQERWQKTTVRLRHLAGTTEARRQARFQKYAEADPTHRWQASYANLLNPPGRLRDWVVRPDALPIPWDECTPKQQEEFQ